MALSGLFCTDVPLRNYSLTPQSTVKSSALSMEPLHL